MRPLCVTDPQYRDHDKKIWSFGQFMPKLVIFAKTVG
jgi:hypothetical protein